MHDVKTFLFVLSLVYGQFLEIHIMEKYRLTYYSPRIPVLFGDQYGLEDFSSLQILEMKYASPGHFDFLGIGTIFSQLIDIINKIIHWKQEYNLAKLQRTKEQFDLIKEMKLDLDKLGLEVQTRQELEAKLDHTTKEIFSWLKTEQVTGIGFRPTKNLPDAK
jgi:hypothetical protein